MRLAVPPMLALAPATATVKVYGVGVGVGVRVGVGVIVGVAVGVFVGAPGIGVLVTVGVGVRVGVVVAVGVSVGALGGLKVAVTVMLDVGIVIMQEVVELTQAPVQPPKPPVVGQAVKVMNAPFVYRPLHAVGFRDGFKQLRVGPALLGLTEVLAVPEPVPPAPVTLLNAIVS